MNVSVTNVMPLGLRSNALSRTAALRDPFPFSSASKTPEKSLLVAPILSHNPAKVVQQSSTGSARCQRARPPPTLLPLDDTRGPRQAAAEDDQQDQVTALEPSFASRLVERNRNRRSGYIAVAVQVHVHLFHGR